MFHKIVNCFTFWINIQKSGIICKIIIVQVVVNQRVTKV